MTERSLEGVVGDALFPEVDAALRTGRHVDQEQFEWYTFLADSQATLEAFYRRYGWELIRVHEGYFYLRPVASRVRRRQLNVATMLAGQALAYMFLDPATVQAAGVVSRDQVLQLLANLVGEERLLEALNPRRRRRDPRTQEALVRQEMDRALRTLEALGFIDLLDETRLRLRAPLLRFADPVKGMGDPREALARLVACGDATVEASPTEPEEEDDEP